MADKIQISVGNVEDLNVLNVVEEAFHDPLHAKKLAGKSGSWLTPQRSWFWSSLV